MALRIRASVLIILACSGTGLALEPDEILIIANSDIPVSTQIAQYYRARRSIPSANILALPLGTSLDDTISRADYKKTIAEPIIAKLYSPELIGKIKCLLTTYGVPIKVGKGEPIKGREKILKSLQDQIQELKTANNKTGQAAPVHSPAQKEKNDRRLARLQSQVDRILGKETDASVDSELSMVLCGDYDLYRWQPNRLKNDILGLNFDTLMVSRLDGPDPQIAKNLIDKAIAAEKTGLNGTAYIDSRGIPDDKKPYSYGHFDQSLRDLAILITLRTQIPVIQNSTGQLFQPGECPGTAIYCGWYSVKKYIDAFEFANGAVGYHISSFEATDLRDPNSTQWCPAMLKRGITATIGAVTEPYLHSFPEPKEFFRELFNGRCLVEAFYHTKRFNSWQLVLIGDPLYTPFRKTHAPVDDDL